MTTQYIMHKDANRLKEEPFKSKFRQDHVSPWVSVATNHYTRLVPSQILMEFLIFPRRQMNFERYQTMLDKAIRKIGKF